MPPESRPTRPLALPWQRAIVSAWSLSQQGRRPVKFRSSLFKGLQGSRGGSAPRPPSAEGGRPFRRAHFSLSNFLFERKKESWKPSALHRGRGAGQRDGGSFGDKRRQPFGAEKPAGPVPGRRTGCPSKTSRWDVLESTEASVRGLVLAGARSRSWNLFFGGANAIRLPGGMGLRRSRFAAGLSVLWR